ncbi:MAG: DNA translocase FtsK [Alphaproteobacteria bacterium]|nr:DNA translocase FtsK [Alphaproteobacteria bacterium]
MGKENTSKRSRVQKEEQGLFRTIFENIPARAWEVLIGFVSIFISVLVLTMWIGFAGPTGEALRIWSMDAVGYAYLILVPFLALFGYKVLFRKEFESAFRFYTGYILLAITTSPFLSVSFGDFVGGVYGDKSAFFIYSHLEEFSAFAILAVWILGMVLVLLDARKVYLFAYEWWTRTINEYYARVRTQHAEHRKHSFEDIEGGMYAPAESSSMMVEDGHEELNEKEEVVSNDEDNGDTDDEHEKEKMREREKAKEKRDEAKKMNSPVMSAQDIRTPKRVGDFHLPPLSLLQEEIGKGVATNTKINGETIKRTLATFRIIVTVEDVVVGPTFTRYSLRPAEGVRLNKITGLQNNLELALAASPIRIEAPIPGESLVGIEVPNATRASVGLRTLLTSAEFQESKEPLMVAFGKTITGGVFSRSLAKMPHALVAGTTGSGKSVLLHSLILSLLYKYTSEQLRFIFIDPKRVELTLYAGIPHLLADPVTDPKKALQSLVWGVNEMERRYQLLEKAKVRDIISYNDYARKEQEKIKIKKEAGEDITILDTIDELPYIVVVIDELADLMQNYPREIETAIVRIAQKARAVGIHLILSTQRPSVNVITGLVKANIPVRVALQVASQIDSRTILDTPGAESLTGRGDLLYLSAEHKKPVRAQSAFVTEDEVKAVATFIIEKNGEPLSTVDFTQKQNKEGSQGESSNEEDELYDEARLIVIQAKKASTSLLQRKLAIGYGRAARLIDILEKNGVVSEQIGNKPREILESENDI